MKLFKPGRLLHLIYQMPERARITLTELAERLGKPVSTLGREINPEDDLAKLGVVTFVNLTDETQDFAPLDYIESALGRVAFKLPTAAGLGELHQSIADAAKECADVIQQLCSDLADGRLDAPEKAIKEIAEAAQALSRLRAVVEMQAKQAPPAPTGGR